MEITYKTQTGKIDQFHLTNLNFVSGRSGIGKSYLLKSLHASLQLKKPQGCIIQLNATELYKSCYIDSRNLISNTYYLPKKMQEIGQTYNLMTNGNILSNGQAFRLYLVTAFYYGEIIIIDEGFASLDIINRKRFTKECLEFLKKSKKNSIIYSSHIMIDTFKKFHNIIEIHE